MLRYAKFVALDDFYLKREHGKYLFTKDKIYYGRFNYDDVLIYDNNDQAIRLEYCSSCFGFKNPHYTCYFKMLNKKAAVNGKEFYKIRTGEN